MRNSATPPVYSQVAYDIAVKIASGELREGQQISGRSLMGSRYGVSPETIRRAMQLLGDIGIVSVRQNVGSVVLSRERAAEYVEQYKSGKDLRVLKAELRELTAQRDTLNLRITELGERIVDLSERFRHSDRLRTYEFVLSPQSPAAGRSIGELSFRQQTGANIVAIKRGGSVDLSPGPQTVLYPGDELIVSCDIGHVARVGNLLG